MEPDTTFAAVLKRHRKARDLTQRALARQAGCATVTIQRIEQGRLRPSRELTEHLAVRLELTPQERARFLRLARAQDGDAAQWEAPAQPELLIGRARELKEIGALIADPTVRAVVLVGMGGVGKTRLALELLTREQQRFSDRARFVSLGAAVSVPEACGVIAEAVGLSFAGQQPLAAQLSAYLASREQLLVLDNVEQIAGCTALIDALLFAAPRLKLLLTSRVALSTRWTWVVPIGGLPFLPQDGESVGGNPPAVDLFLRHARRYGATVPHDERERRAVAHICRLVEGLPLAIELAAAWAPILSCTAIAERVAADCVVLTAREADRPVRHHSIEAVLNQSWRMLTADEQALLARIAIFRGGCTLEAAQHVADATLATLAGLLTKNLLRRNDRGRYELHELVREFASQRLTGEAELAALHERFVRYCSSYAGSLTGSTHLLYAEDAVSRLDRIDADHANFRLALQIATVHRCFHDLATALAGSLWPFWVVRGYATEGRRWLAPLVVRIRSGEAQVAPVEAAQALEGSGVLAHHQGADAEALELLRASLALWRDHGSPEHVVAVLNRLGWLYIDCGELHRAQEVLEEAYGLAEKHRLLKGLAAAVTNLGWVALHRCQHAQAEQLFAQSLDLAQEVEHPHGIATAYVNLATVANHLQRPSSATHAARAALALYQQIGDQEGVAECLEALAVAAGCRGRLDWAMLLAGSAAALREQIAVPLRRADGRLLQETVVRALLTLDQREYARAVARGRGLALSDILSAELAAPND